MALFVAAPLRLTAKTFVVNVVGDEEDPNAGEFDDDGLCDVDLATPGEQCTLRAAIQNHNANRHLGQNTINVAVPGAAPIIHVTKPLPPVLGSVIIDGINSGGPGRLEIDGAMAGSDAVGLSLWGDNCILRFVAIYNFSSHGIHVAGTPPPGGGGHILEANRIGTDTDATTDKGNGGDGIYIEDTPGCVIGGAGIAKRNIISGNEGYGIHVLGRDPAETGAPTSGAPNTEILGNIIGLDFFESAPLPNTLGGVFIENARDQAVGSTDAGKGNQISGGQTGVKIEGSLANGIKIIGNFIGKDGTGAKFDVGILSRGKLVTIESNAITNVAGVGVDAFLNADGTYNFRKNEFDGKMTIGTKLTFGEGRTITVQYENNFHAENGKAVEFNESINSTIHWNVFGNFAQLGTTGGSMVIKANGNKNFTDNTWELHAEAGFRFIADIDQNVRSIVTIQGEIYDKNGLEGVGVNATVRGELTYVLLRTKSSNSGKDGLLLEAFVGAGASLSMSGSELDIRANLEAGIRAIMNETVVPFAVFHIERSLVTGNQEDGMVLFGFDIKPSIVDNVISDNGGSGIRLGSNSDAHIEGNTITGNGSGVHVQDVAHAAIVDNDLTGNGTAIALAGTATGTSIQGNSIAGSTVLGIDLGNDGPTPNDAGDVDTGPNGLQNFPVIQSAVVAADRITITGTLDTAPVAVVRLDFFASAACHPSGYGEGDTFLGMTEVTTGADGSAAFVAEFTGASVAIGAAITATATAPGGNTSEFSACISAQATPTELATRLAAGVDAWVQSGALSSSEGAALTSRLELSRGHFDAGYTNAAIGEVRGFIDQVNAFVASGDLTITQSQALLAQAESFLENLPQGGLANISTRAHVGVGAGQLIAGFVVEGTQAKEVLIRAIGPKLVDFGIASPLANPVVTLFQDQANLGANDDWGQGDAAAIIAASARVGAFDLDTGSTDAVMLRALDPRAYTAVVSGISDTTGVALVEIYDATLSTALSPQQRLANISSRGQVGTGADILIAGFVVTGAVPRTCLLRGVGPKLTDFGVSDVLADPVLELFQGSAVIASNDDWGEGGVSSMIVAAAVIAGAFELDAGSRDAVLLVSLAPGAYTIHIRGKGETTGVALAEVYEM